MSTTENKPLLQKAMPVADYEIDATNMRCPLPLLKLKQALNQARNGEIIFIKATDSTSERDFNAYIQTTRHELVLERENNLYLYWITKRQ